MSTKFFLVISTIALLVIPTGTALVGYLLLTSHLQGFAAAALGWLLFLGGFASIPLFAAATVELHQIFSTEK